MQALQTQAGMRFSKSLVSWSERKARYTFQFKRSFAIGAEWDSACWPCNPLPFHLFWRVSRSSRPVARFHRPLIKQSAPTCTCLTSDAQGFETDR
jgi:hypothetical protein